jgi:hypothetical protein
MLTVQELEDNFKLFIKYYTEDKQKTELMRYFNKYAYGKTLNNKPHGLWLIISKDDKLTATFNFINGILNGDAFYYDQDTQCIIAYYIFKNSKIIKKIMYYQSIFIGRRNIENKSKYYKFFPGDCFDSKYDKYYPIPKELEPYINNFYLTHDYINTELYNEYLKKNGLEISKDDYS